MNQARVGGNCVALFDEDDVAGHDLRCRVLCRSPSRITFAWAAAIWRSAATADSARIPGYSP